MNFEVYGPFPITRMGKGKAIAHAPADKRAFWDDVDAHHEGLSEACGCYVFVVRGRAWYVGRAVRQTFRKECFSIHKIVQYNDALQTVSGPPSLILLAKQTRGGQRFAKPAKTGRGHPDVCFLENLLIGSALGRNPQLQNIKGTKLLKEMRVPGVLNPPRGRARIAVQKLKKALGV